MKALLILENCRMRRPIQLMEPPRKTRRKKGVPTMSKPILMASQQKQLQQPRPRAMLRNKTKATVNHRPQMHSIRRTDSMPLCETAILYVPR